VQWDGVDGWLKVYTRFCVYLKLFHFNRGTRKDESKKVRSKQGGKEMQERVKVISKEIQKKNV
jgi:hypothetical protein